MLRKAALASSVVASIPIVVPLTRSAVANTCRIHVKTARGGFPDRAGAASARSSNAPASARRGPALGTRGARANRRSATRCRAPNQCLRSTRSRAAGSRSPVAGLDDRSGRRTSRIALPRRRQTRARRAPDSVADRTGAHQSGATHSWQPTTPASARGPCDDSWPCREFSTSDRSCRSPFNHGLLGSISVCRIG